MMTFLYEQIEKRLRTLPALDHEKAIVREAVPQEELDARVQQKEMLCIVELASYEETPGEGLGGSWVRREVSPVTRDPESLPEATVEGTHHGNHFFRLTLRGGRFTLYRRIWDFQRGQYGSEGVVASGGIPTPPEFDIGDGTRLVLFKEPTTDGEYTWETLSRRVYAWIQQEVRARFRMEFLTHKKAALFGDGGVMERLSELFAPQGWVNGELLVRVSPRGGRWIRGDWEQEQGLFRAVYEIEARFPRVRLQESPLMTQFNLGGTA